VARKKAGATQAPRMCKQMSINLKSIGEMVVETLSLDLPTVRKNTCLKNTQIIAWKSHSFADKCTA